MVCPKGCRLFGQATPDTILKHPDCLFYLPIGITIANVDVVMDNAQLFTAPRKAARKLGAIISPNVAWLTPTSNQVIIEELGHPLAMQQRHSADLHPLGEWIHSD